ncbi:MAG TPA: succinate dehydrogenase, hydrophobic membrane anchor protein [Allosphingosinicella sp.]|nr:succinate dehydrogenase, hydrophobic membrane anchor protein [Allosphingosinicella sp.]
MSMETPLARVRGLGAAGAGGQHWWHERTTSAALFLLLVWLAVSLVRLPGLDYGTVREWLSQPVAAVPMLLLIVVTFQHIKHGLTVIIEDYVHDEGSKLFWLMVVNFAAVLAAALALFAVLKVALGAEAD